MVLQRVIRSVSVSAAFRGGPFEISAGSAHSNVRDTSGHVGDLLSLFFLYSEVVGGLGEEGVGKGGIFW